MKKIWFYTLILFALCLAACDDTDKLEADITSLTDRITALENKVEMLNGNIKALHVLCQDGMIISAVEHDAEKGIYTISLSDGTKLKLVEKTEGFGIAPLISIGEDGNWQVSYDNGTTYAPIMKGDAPVQAVGKDGVTPAFRVGAGDYWEVSLDGGTTYAQVKDEGGNPVKAVYDPSASSDQQFESVVDNGSSLEVKLSGGRTVTVPIVPDFFCYFDEAITGEQKINPGETKTFNVHIKGADHTVVTAPMGWKATLADADARNVAVLTVIAPAAATTATRAVADNTRDISILAVKGTFATLTKIQVNPIEVSGGEVTPPTPSGPVTELIVPLASNTTFTSIAKYTNSAINTHLSGDTDFWFHRQTDAITTVSMDAAEVAVKATVTAAKGSWNNSSFGFHCAGTFDRTQKYKLTFQTKSDMEGSVGVGIRNSDDTRGFRMIKPDGSNWERNVTTPATTADWVEVSIVFDFGHASTVMASVSTTYNEKEEPTTDTDVEGINIYLYNNKANTTLYVKDVKLARQ